MNINRKNDYAFKRIFGSEETKDILARFLTVVLSAEIQPEELTIINPQLDAKYLADKASVLDISVKRAAAHEKMNIEMQITEQGNIGRRILQYWARGYAEDLKAGQDYDDLPKMINILIADFNVFDWRDATKFHSVFHVREDAESVIFCDALEIHVLELPKLRRQKVTKNFDGLQGWLLYLDNLDKGSTTMQTLIKREPLIKRALTFEDIFTQDEEARRLYRLREKGYTDYMNAMRYSGRKGELRGEKKANFRVARALVLTGMAAEQVAKITGLPMNEITKLPVK